jgi:hypothetical protein
MAQELKAAGGVDEHKKLVQMAMQVLYAYEIMAMTDAARCEDGSAPNALGMNTLWERYQSSDVRNATSFSQSLISKALKGLRS